MKILFEDENIVAIDKPSGLPSHSLKTTDTSVESLLKAQRKNWTTPESILLLHRLDTGTSGVLLFAKTPEIYEKMRHLFRERAIKKYYRAWTALTTLSQEKFHNLIFPHRINFQLAHHPKSKKRMIALVPQKKRTFRGKPLDALTIIHSATKTKWMNGDSIEFKIEIITGVMHQIRVHLAELGFPLMNDVIYGRIGSEAKKTPDQILKNPRLGLHAQKVEFTLDGRFYEIESPTPKN